MITPDIANDRLENAFKEATAMFFSGKSFRSSIKLHTKGNDVFIIPLNVGAKDVESKDAIAFSAQFLYVLLGDVSFVTIESEAFALAVAVKSAAEARKMHKEISEEHANINIAEIPGVNHMIIASYDDGTNKVAKAGRIVTNDSGKKTLDIDPSDELIKFVKEKRFYGEPSLNDLINKARTLKNAIVQSVKGFEFQIKKDMSAEDLIMIFANSMSDTYHNGGPSIGAKIALELYKASKKKAPDMNIILSPEPQREPAPAQREAPVPTGFKP